MFRLCQPRHPLLKLEDSWIDEIVKEAATAAIAVVGNVVNVVSAEDDATGEVESADELMLLVPEVLRRWIAAILSPENKPEAVNAK